MPRSASGKQWLAASGWIAAFIALTFAGGWIYAAAIPGIPVAAAVCGIIRVRVPGMAGIAAVAGAGAVALVLFPAIPGIPFAAAAITGALLKPFFSRRPGEDDCYHLAPAVFLALTVALFGLNWLVGGRALEEARQSVTPLIEKARETQARFVEGASIPEEEPARWVEAGRILPYRLTGALAVAGGVLFYIALTLARPWLGGVIEVKNRFQHFRVKERYVIALAASLAAQAIWIAQARPWAAHLAHGLWGFSVAAFFLQATGICAWKIGQAENKAGAWLLAALGALALAAAPPLALPFAALGLADVWLDFRKLETTLGGVRT